MADKINPRKEMENLEKTNQKNAKTRIMIQCNCPHTRKNELRLLQSRDDPKVFICQECQKKISIKRIEEDEFNKSCDVLDGALDIIKMKLDTSRDDDLDILEELSKIQFKIKTRLPNYYRNANKNKKKKNRNFDDNRRGGWERPSTDR